MDKDSALLGLIAGLTHHVTLQYPNQKPLFTTLTGFAFLEATFIAFLFIDYTFSLSAKTISVNLVPDVSTFNAVYV